MTASKFSDHAAQALRAVQHGGTVPQAVFLPPVLRQNTNIVYALSKDTKLPSIKQSTLRIAQEADPIGLIIAIAIGQPVPTFNVDAEGNINVKYETLPLGNAVRERMIKYLADRIVPRLSVKATSAGGSEPPAGAATTEWEALLGSGDDADE